MSKNNVVNFLETHAKMTPNKVVFHYQNHGVSKKLTYREFNAKSAITANYLNDRGISKGDRLIIAMPLSVDLYLAIAATQRLGAIPVLLDSIREKSELEAIIENATPKGVVTRKELFPFINLPIQISVEEVHRPRGKKMPIQRVKKTDSALITYTTGSSGKPKGANRTHGFLLAQHRALKRLFPYGKSDIDLPVFPVFTLNNIASGITTVLPPIDISQPCEHDENLIYKQLKKYKANCMTLAPSSLKRLTSYCLDQGKILTGINRVLTGGAPIAAAEIETFRQIAPEAKIYILYGSTEVEPISFIEAAEFLKLSNSSKSIGVNVGKIDPKLKMKIIRIYQEKLPLNISPDDLTVKPGEVGEIIVSGDNVCPGYFNNQDAFLHTKIKDAAEKIWHRTGDLGLMDENNNLLIAGRVHNIVMSRGEILFPVRPELIMKEIPGVLNAAYLNAIIKGEEKIIAAITCQMGKEKLLRELIYGKLKNSNYPLDQIIFLESMPMDVRHHSKINYKLLRNRINELSC